MWFFKKSLSTDEYNNEEQKQDDEKLVNLFEQSGDLEHQATDRQRSLRYPPRAQSISNDRTLSRRESTLQTEFDEKAVQSTLRVPAPSHSRRSSTDPEDPFSDAAIASRPCTPIREISSDEVPQLPDFDSRQSSVSYPSRKSALAHPLPHHRRKSLAEEPLTQSRRKSSCAQSLDLPHRRGSSSHSQESRTPQPSYQPQHHRRKSSAVAPHHVASSRTSHESQPRRKSSTTDPLSDRRSSETNKHHLPNARKHITFDVPEDEADDDQITVLRAPPFGNAPYFNADFTLDGKRRASQSLHNQHLLTSKDTRHPGQLAGRRKSSCVLVNRRASKYGIEEEKEVRAIGKKRLYWTKIGVIITFIIFNVGFSAISWVFPKYWWVFAPVILLGNALNTLMVLNLTRCWIQGLIVKGYRRVSNKPVTPPSIHIPTTIAMVLACYCESYTDLMRTLDSLSEQEKIEHHKKMFIVICDGQVKGKGMEKSTDRILVEDIFKPDEEMYFPVGYESWDGAINGVYASCGVYNDIPYCCIVKKRNLGKRDGLILIRTLLYKYQERYGNPITSMGSDFFTWFCEFSESHGIDKFEWLVGVDADTTFNNECIYELHKDCVADPKLIGSSGLIQVGWQTGNWNLWNLYQNTEYMRAQCLRRMHQALGTGKVSCLPGACQIIKICEESCGDKILIDLFGQLPDPKDNLVHQIRALAGEDRNYICLIFFNSPKVQTTMSLKAIAYTDPPNGFWVFLSQRKRWTLSTCANDILIVSKNQMNWFERLCSVADILSWGLPFFILQTFALFVKACIHAEDFVFLLAFAMLTIIPITYGFVVTIWACHGWRFKLQYLIGMFMLITMAQGVTPIVIAYAIWHMDNFAWGKTREIEEDPENKPAHSE